MWVLLRPSTGHVVSFCFTVGDASGSRPSSWYSLISLLSRCLFSLCRKRCLKWYLEIVWLSHFPITFQARGIHFSWRFVPETITVVAIKWQFSFFYDSSYCSLRFFCKKLSPQYLPCFKSWWVSVQISELFSILCVLIITLIYVDIQVVPDLPGRNSLSQLWWGE